MRFGCQYCFPAIMSELHNWTTYHLVYQVVRGASEIHTPFHVFYLVTEIPYMNGIREM